MRTVECIDGMLEVEVICEPAFAYGSEPARWEYALDGEFAVDASGGGQTVRLASDIALGIEGDRVRGRHVLRKGDRAFCALSWADGLATPHDAADAQRRIETTSAFWRAWLSRARIPDHRWLDGHTAFGARHQRFDVYAHRRHRGGAHDFAAGDARRRAELGLPVHLGARLHVYAAGPSLPQPRLGSG